MGTIWHLQTLTVEANLNDGDSAFSETWMNHCYDSCIELRWVT